MAYSEQVLHRARARLEQAKAEREQENAAYRRHGDELSALERQAVERALAEGKET